MQYFKNHLKRNILGIAELLAVLVPHPPECSTLRDVLDNIQHIHNLICRSPMRRSCLHGLTEQLRVILLSSRQNKGVIEISGAGIEHYSENGNLALEMSYKNEDNMDEPFTMLTVNLSEKCAPNCAYVDTNDNPWAESFIAEHGLGVPTGRTRRSGFCEYPEYAFDMQKIEQHLLCPVQL